MNSDSRDKLGRFKAGSSPWNLKKKMPLLGEIKICKECLCSFAINTHNKIFCSLTCRNKHYKNDPKIKRQNLKKTRRYQSSIHGKIKIEEYKESKIAQAKLIARTKKYKNDGRRKKSADKYYKSQNGRINYYFGTLKRRERLKKLTSSYTKKEWNEKLKKTNGICPRCKKQIGISSLTMDHIIPISKAPSGFNYTIKDIQPLCKSCNCSKGGTYNV